MKVSKADGRRGRDRYGRRLLGAPVPSASAQPCPDVEVIFARGTGEPPGVGGVGQAFVDALRSEAGGKSVGGVSGQLRRRAATSATPWRSLRPSSTESGTRAPTSQSMAASCPEHPDRARRLLAGRRGGGIRHLGRGAAGRPCCPRAHSRCRSRWPTMSPRSLCSASRRRHGRASTARRRSRSARPTRRRPSSCAHKATRSATAPRVAARVSRTPCIR